MIGIDWNRVRAALILVTVLATAAMPVRAEKEPYTRERFAELQAQGAVILVDVHADWCPTCAKQQRVLEDYESAHPEVSLHRLVVDFDNDKATVSAFRAPRQSTLILFRGTEQRWFSVAETRADVVFAAIDAAAGKAP